MGDADAAATAVTGALVARAIEPHAGGGGTGGDQAHDGLCRNCGTTLVGPHCHHCGQARHVHRTMSAIGHDIAHGVFHFEGKIWRTLPMLALKPGELTRRYIDGERARFVSPMALFLFSVFLMFAIVANLPGWHFGGDEWLKPGLSGGVQQARAKLAEERAHAEAQIAEYQASLKEERARREPRAGRIDRLNRRIADAQKLRGNLDQAERVLPKATTLDVAGAPEPTADNWLDQKMRQARENPKLLLYKLKTSAYKFSWALIPISLPFLWLLFPLRRDVGMYDHAVFATYSLTFMSLLVIVLAVLGAIGVPTWLLAVAAFGIPPFHIYRQLKGAYRLGRGGALWRLFWLLNFIWIALTLFLVLLLYLGVAD